MKARFEQFLKDQGVYAEFVNNLEVNNHLSFGEYVEKTLPELYVTNAFCWCDDDVNKWSQLDIKWTAVVVEETDKRSFEYMYAMFIAFLSQTRCLKMYRQNVENPITEENTDFENWLSSSFNFSESRQGHVHWNMVNREWKALLQETLDL